MTCAGVDRSSGVLAGIWTGQVEREVTGKGQFPSPPLHQSSGKVTFLVMCAERGLPVSIREQLSFAESTCPD